jgi:hypothetical protein
MPTDLTLAAGALPVIATGEARQIRLEIAGVAGATVAFGPYATIRLLGQAGGAPGTGAGKVAIRSRAALRVAVAAVALHSGRRCRRR